MKVIDKLTPEIGPMLSVPAGRRADAAHYGRGHRGQERGRDRDVERLLGLWISMGLQNTGGKLITFEIDPEKVKMARRISRRPGWTDGDRGGRRCHVKIKESLKAPLDMVFIDAEKEGYPDYLKQLLPLVGLAV